VVAHFHYTFVPIAIIATFSGITMWFPKMFGRMMNETLGKIHFWGTVIPFNLIFIPLFFTGAAGDHRRIFDYSNFPDLMRPELQALRITADAVARGHAAVPARVPLQLHLQHRPRAEGREEPVAFEHAGLDHRLAAAHGNWPELPQVYRGPYEYSVPGRKQDYWPQDEPA
jgi:cytochrome c oxidase subunit 1